ncbi:MAG: protein jag [Armatimonadetes bacterium]|nr:protein jag [Armatimonadota bacterium]
MESVEQSGRTIEEATEAALSKLGLGLSQVVVEVLDEGSKGIFGLGSKMARVKVIPREERTEIEVKAQRVLADILRILGLRGDARVEKTSDAVRADVTGKGLGVLIGKHGQTLDALQFLVGLIVNRGREERSSFILDVEGYRAKREDVLRDLAGRLAQKALEEGRNVVLEPMLAYERRIIHMALQGNPQVTTYSQGEEPLRKVIIAPKRN